ncbi:MAG: hypothetical protein V2A56_08485 [bacterium]
MDTIVSLLIIVVSLFALWLVLDFIVLKRILIGTRRNWPVVVILMAAISIFWSKIRTGDIELASAWLHRLALPMLLLFSLASLIVLTIGLLEQRRKTGESAEEQENQ